MQKADVAPSFLCLIYCNIHHSSISSTKINQNSHYQIDYAQSSVVRAFELQLPVDVVVTAWSGFLSPIAIHLIYSFQDIESLRPATYAAS